MAGLYLKGFPPPLAAPRSPPALQPEPHPPPLGWVPAVGSTLAPLFLGAGWRDLGQDVWMKGCPLRLPPPSHFAPPSTGGTGRWRVPAMPVPAWQAAPAPISAAFHSLLAPTPLPPGPFGEFLCLAPTCPCWHSHPTGGVPLARPVAAVPCSRVAPGEKPPHPGPASPPQCCQVRKGLLSLPPAPWDCFPPLPFELSHPTAQNGECRIFIAWHGCWEANMRGGGGCFGLFFFSFPSQSSYFKGQPGSASGGGAHALADPICRSWEWDQACQPTPSPPLAVPRLSSGGKEKGLGTVQAPGESPSFGVAPRAALSPPTVGLASSGPGMWHCPVRDAQPVPGSAGRADVMRGSEEEEKSSEEGSGACASPG